MNLHNTQKNKNSQSTEGQKDSTILFWKNPGETLAVMLRRFREEYNLSETEKITYAGRLDPMAEGIVPVLVGGARFQKDRLMGKSKTYEVDILLGISTDTGDMLGLTTSDPTLNAVKSKLDSNSTRSDLAIKNAIMNLSQITELSYPNYSSRPVDGKPLFIHARAGKKVVLPMRKVIIYSMELVEIKDISLRALLSNALEIIKKVQGDFRQKEIIEQWTAFADPPRLSSSEARPSAAEMKIVKIITIRTTVSSGTYMRSLAEKMGELLGVPALASRIVRINIEE